MKFLPVASLCALIAMGVTSISDAQTPAQRSPGEQEYLNSCASCHGPAGKGDGPVAPSLKHPPADLTKLSQNNNGVFPVAHTLEVIDGRLEVAAHGKRDMPVWGEVYNPAWDSGVIATPPNAKDLAEWIARLRMLALVEFISTIQER